MLPTQILDKLNHINIPPNIAGLLLHIGELKVIKTKRVLIDIGEPCQYIFFILNGGFISQYLTEDGNYSTVNFYLHNFQPFVTIPNAYFFGENSKFQIKSITKSNILCFSKSDLENLIAESPLFSEWYQQMVIKALVEEYNAKSNLITLPSKDMYNYLINEQSEIIQQVPSLYIAQYLGISREHLSRIRKEIDAQ